MRVLIADDSDVSRTLLAHLLGAWGYEVVACADGEAAWAMLQGPDAPPLAIFDWVMPGCDGLELCRRLRRSESGRHVFVYLLSARSSTEDMLTGLEAGANDYLIKPFNRSELRVRLHNGRKMVELHQELVRAREALRAQAMRDPLTQLWNRRAFAEVTGKALRAAARAGRPTSALMIDVDHFKRVNDEHGHAAGDEVLREVARRAAEGLRAGDHLARYGGEELAALLPDCGPGGAFLVAERVRARVRARPIVLGEARLTVTVSVGAACSLDGREPLDALLDRADRALYRAKHAGRDRSALESPLEATGTG